LTVDLFTTVQVHHSGSRGHCFTKKKSESASCAFKTDLLTF